MTAKATQTAMLIFLQVFAIVISWPAFAQSGELKGTIDCQYGYCLIKNLALTGPIDHSTTERLVRIFEEFRQQADAKKQPELFSHTEIKLDSPGGSVSAAMAIGRLLRQNRMMARIKPGAVCNSACVLTYAGAVLRHDHFHSGKLGIHQPYFEVPQQTIDPKAIGTKYAAMLREMRLYFREMNVSEQLADEMLKTPPSRIRYLTPPEVDQFGLVTSDPVETEISSLEEAQKLGLTRAEYTRRQLVSAKVCPLDIGFYKCANEVLRTGNTPLLDLSAFGTPVE